MLLTPTKPKLSEPRFDSLQQEAFLNLWRTYDRLRQLEDQMFARHDLTAQQYNALRLLRRHYPETLPTLEIASKLISRAPDITRLLDKLNERGLVSRERTAANRRVVQVSLTEEGRALLDELAEEVADCHRRQLGHLSKRNLQLLIELLAQAREPHEANGSSWRGSMNKDQT